MNNNGNNNPVNKLTSGDLRAIQYFHAAVLNGKNWYISLLEATAMWDSMEETYRGHRYCYLIDNEAFDWQLLAERLCETIDGLLPENEKNDFLLHNQPPVDIKREQFRDYVGSIRYRQYLNFYYGVTIERALVLAVMDEIRKERNVAGYLTEKDTSDEAFYRVYRETESVLLGRFQKERRYRRRKSISLGELKEFTYWLFKYRIKNNDKERVASDTRKALEWVERNGPPNRMLKDNLRPVIE